MTPLAQAFLKEYYEWTSLGQGVTEWDVPVTPEPLYMPFNRGMAIDFVPPEDDGRLSTMFEKFGKAFKGQKPPVLEDKPSPFSSHLKDSPPDYIQNELEHFYEVFLLPPEKENISRTAFEAFLKALHPEWHLTFEILMMGENLFLCLVVAEQDLNHVLNLVGTFFPSMGVSIQEEFVLLNDYQAFEGRTLLTRELALDKEFFFPIQPLGKNPVDPYSSLFSALAEIETEEIGAIQIQFEPCVSPWNKALINALQWDDETAFFEKHPEYLKFAEAKVSTPLYGVNVRIASLADSEERARYIGKTIAKSFHVYDGFNSFSLAPARDLDPDDEVSDFLLRRFRRSGMLLNQEELQALIHVPNQDVYAPRLMRLVDAPATAPPEEVIKENEHVLGTSLYGTEELPVSISTRDRLRHTHVIGASGSGKSTYLLHSILQDIEQGVGVAVLDPHGDLVEDILLRIPPERVKDVILFDPADEDYPVGFNILNAKSDIEKNLLESDLVSIFQRLATSWGDQMTTVLANATMAFLESSKGGTLSDLTRFLLDQSYRESFIKTVDNPDVRLFWEHEFKLLKGNTVASLVGRLNTFMRTKVLRNMVVQKEDKLDFREAMDSGKIFLAPLSMGLIGEENTKLIGSLLVSKFYQTALTRQDVEEDQRAPFFLYLDEAAHFATSSLATILTGTRKYGLGLVLAHHYLNQFGSQNADVLNALLSNAHTRLCFKVEDQDARRMASAFDGFEDNTLRQLTVGKAVCRIGPSDHSFPLNTLHPDRLPAPDADLASQAKDHSRAAYARPKSEVEEEYEKHVQARIDASKPKKTTRQIAEEKVDALAKDQPVKKSEPPKPIVEEEPQEEEEPKAKVSPTTETILDPEPQKPQPNTDLLQNLDPVIPAANIVSPEAAKEEGSLKGRGGATHKTLQAQIKKFADAFGLGAETEYQLPDKSRVDVRVKGNGVEIAFEVALGTDSNYEVGSIKKALAQEMKVVMVSNDQKHLDLIERKAEKEGLLSDQDAVTFLHEEDLATYFQTLSEDMPSQEGMVSGYKTKRKVSPPSKDTETKMEALYRMMSED